MKLYACQVRYTQGGQQNSVLHQEFATSALDAAENIADRMRVGDPMIFAINDRKDFMILKVEDVLNVTVIRGE